MKSSIILILILILSSCSNEPTKNDVASKKESEYLRKTKPLKLYYVDFKNEECKSQITKAIIDSDNGDLIFIDPTGWTIIRYDQEMEEVLSKFGINYEVSGPNCTLEQECYGYYMDSIIHNKHGENFIKEVRKKSDSLFLSRWKTKIYEYWDIDEIPFYSKYPTEDFLKEQVKFPIGWDTIPMKFERQYLTAELTISNTGKLEKWKHGEMSNIKETNKRFVPALKKQVENIISKMKIWIPGKLDEKNVNTKIWVDINLDAE